MSSKRSLFSKASSSKHSLLGASSHELPRWRSPSPMAQSMIPPPIVQSTYALPPRAVTQSILIEKPSPLQDRQSELEADLQFLLDAQADGLVRAGGLTDDHTSTGSTTPTAQSVRSASARRAARPVRQKPGLRSARKGIYNAILALSLVKDEELRGIDDEVRDREQTLEQIDDWEKKRVGLQEAAKSVDENEDTVRVQRLKQEADMLQTEINHVELQLAEMKARHRKLLRQATAVENSVQAKLASYTSSLRILEEDVQKFLSLRPTENSPRPEYRDGQTSMWQLPGKRRTLEMARKHWNEERESVLEQREDVQHEKHALDEGAAVWKDVVTQITEFERSLRTEMSRQPATSSNSAAAWGDPDVPQADVSQRLQEVLQLMERLTDTLESKVELAKDRNWNLLIAAIGAELDALRQGRQLLEGVLKSNEGQSAALIDTSQNGGPTSNSGDEIHELDKSFETARRRMSDGTESEDDPDPELLFSRQDTDTE